MPVQSSMLEEVLSLAKGLKVLRPDQLDKIQKLAPTMDEGGLLKVKTSLEKIQAVHAKEMAGKMEVLQNAGAVRKEWQADKARVQLTQAESADSVASQEEADHLLSTLK